MSESILDGARAAIGTPIGDARSGAIGAIIAGLGAFIAISCLAQADLTLRSTLLIAPFGATAVLIFAMPDSALAQPRNVIGGHLISTGVGLFCHALLGHQPLAFGLGVGLAVAAMMTTRTLHPPAGADPIVVITAGATLKFMVLPVLAGVLLLAAMGASYRILRRRFGDWTSPASRREEVT